MSYTVEARLFDGVSARVSNVEVELDADPLIIWDASGATDQVERRLLKRDVSQPPRLVLHRADQPDWRLVFATTPTAAQLNGIPSIHRFGRGAMTAYLAVTAGLVSLSVAIWLFGGVLLSATAPLIPVRVLQPIGRTLVLQFGGARCTAPAGDAALQRLTDRLTQRAKGAAHIDISIAENPAVNAIAVPGDQIVIFRGLIEKANGPDEVAGVLAHELAHVAHLDPTKAVMRQMGITLLVQSIGGTVGSMADQAVLLAGSREAEHNADVGALELLEKAAISPAGLASFFKRMDDSTGKTPTHSVSSTTVKNTLDQLANYASTHPLDAERAEMIAKAAAESRDTWPAISTADWQSLRAICTEKAAQRP